jgi:predicted DNA-binding ribbon-helix-helix protein
MRLRRIARRRNVSMAQIVNEILAAKTSTTELTAKDYAAIAHATKQAEETGRRIATQYPDTA